MTLSRKPRINELIEYDLGYGRRQVVVGLDEAGRGPVAGPVTACALILNKIDKDVKDALKYLDDSKKFGSNPKLRKQICEEVKKHSLYKICHCSVEEIEKHNILQASLLAMKRASQELLEEYQSSKTPMLLVDGNFIIPDYDLKQQAVKKGDSKSASIAAASIIAKVTRDELMISLAEEFPHYDWHKNKGYGTKAHIEAIKKFGKTKWHRESFLTKCLNK